MIRGESWALVYKGRGELLVSGTAISAPNPWEAMRSTFEPALLSPMKRLASLPSKSPYSRSSSLNWSPPTRVDAKAVFSLVARAFAILEAEKVS